MIVRRIQNDELCHHGIKGQRWGIRRYQNEDGSLTADGKKRYGTVENFEKVKARNKKILKAVAITGATTLAAAAIYVGANKYIQENVGQKIKEMDVQRVTVDDIDDTTGRMYVANNFFDKLKYKGMYGYGELGTKAGKYTVNKLKVKNVKIAPDKVSREEFMKLYNDDKKFKDVVDTAIGLANNKPGKQGNLFRKVQFKSNYKNNKKYEKDLYDAFNISNSFAYENPAWDNHAKENINKFYDAIKKRGYNGIYDRNDIKYSGYKSKSPKIIFSGSNVTDLGSKTVNMYSAKAQKDFATAAAIRLGQEVAPLSIGVLTAYSAAKVSSDEVQERLNKNDSKKNIKR